jgi:diaminopimelate epimerase
MVTRFLKMHGTGNDFVLIDCVENIEMRSYEDSRFSSVAEKICDRRFGVGADQLLLLFPSEKADFMMRIFNADGSEVEMCGNGIRCLAKYVWNKGYSDKETLEIDTPAGIIKPRKSDNLVTVDMGKPKLEARDIPLKLQGTIIDHPLKIEDREFKITCVSMGNPHAVIVVDNVDDFPVSYYGPLIETHALFPKRTNVEFIEIVGPKDIRMRVWERGSGETLACGTGASAVSVASAVKKLTGRDVTVHLLGGDLFLKWGENDHVFMTGPAVSVFSGVIEL